MEKLFTYVNIDSYMIKRVSIGTEHKGISHKVIADFPPSNENAENQANEIVRAANLYPELVKALELVAELSDRNDYETYFDTIHKIVRPVLAKTRE